MEESAELPTNARAGGNLPPCLHFRLWVILWTEFHSMATIQVILEPELLKAADRVAKSAKINRSALVREALRAHIKRITIREMEERERRAYEKQPQQPDEWEPWLNVAVWPEE